MTWCVVEDVIMFTGMLILAEDVDSVKNKCIEADAQKLKSGSLTVARSETTFKCFSKPLASMSY